MHSECDDELDYQLPTASYSAHWSWPEHLHHYIREVQWQLQLWSTQNRCVCIKYQIITGLFNATRTLSRCYLRSHLVKTTAGAHEEPSMKHKTNLQTLKSKLQAIPN